MSGLKEIGATLGFLTGVLAKQLIPDGTEILPALIIKNSACNTLGSITCIQELLVTLIFGMFIAAIGAVLGAVIDAMVSHNGFSR